MRTLTLQVTWLERSFHYQTRFLTEKVIGPKLLHPDSGLSAGIFRGRGFYEQFFRLSNK